MRKGTTHKDAVGSGTIKLQGNEGKLEELMCLSNFDFWRMIITPQGLLSAVGEVGPAAIGHRAL
ncbi:MAG: hypothetical protein JSS14_14735 [Proteobacteria bacterium]|nr:hypothetical protein [Pseudomonadota bacterium]